MAIDNNAINAISSDPLVQAKLRELAASILSEAKANIVAMDAVDTGELLNSGSVEFDGKTFRVSFAADHADIIHEGEGSSRGRGPRPFLSSAALRNRGRIG